MHQSQGPIYLKYIHSSIRAEICYIDGKELHSSMGIALTGVVA